MKAFAALTFALTFATATARGAPAPERHISRDKSFSIVVPKGEAFDFGEQGSVARWTNPALKTVAAIYSVSDKNQRRYNGSALEAAKRSRESRPSGGKDELVSKVVKKSLGNGLTLYFFTAQAAKSASTNRQVTGFFELGGALYQVGGWVSKQQAGLDTLYWTLGTMKPLSRPKGGKRAITDEGKPAIIREQEGAGVALE